MWLLLFHDCHEFAPSGSFGKVKGRKDQAKPLGHYSRKEWPFPGGVMKQPNILTQVFQVINSQLDHDQMIGIEIQV